MNKDNEFHEEEAFRARLREWPEQEPSPDCVNRIVEAVLSEPSSPPLLFPRILAAAAATILLLLGAWAVLNPEEPTVNHAARPVDQALQWLEKMEATEGGWRADTWGGNASYSVGLSGLALMSYLKHQPDNNPIIDRTTHWLQAVQTENGRFGPPVHDALYNHGIATLALLERYQEKPSANLKASIDQALVYLVKGQQPNGAWRYGADNQFSYQHIQAGQTNSGISIWPFRALLRADELGFDKAGHAADRSRTWLARLIDQHGRIGYTKPGDLPSDAHSLLALGAVVLKESGEAIPEAFDQQLQAELLKSDQDYYSLYHLATAGEGRIDLGEFQDHLLTRLETEGPQSGSWKPDDRWSQAGGRIYATAMASLGMPN